MKRYFFANFMLDTQAFSLERAGERLELRTKGLELLALLVERAPRVVEKQELIDALWPDVSVGENSLAQCVRQLRTALGPAADGDPEVVVTVHGRGYRLGVPVEVAEAAPQKRTRLHRSRVAWGAAVGVIIGILLLAQPMPLPERAPPPLPKSVPPAYALAVLPFDDLSPGAVQTHVAEGLTEEITHAAASASGLTVVARTSASALHRRGLDARAIGRQLEVGSLLEGSVRREGDALRVTVQLIDTTTGDHRWSRTWDRSADDLLTTQTEIGSEVARILERDLGVRVPGRRRSRVQPTLEAYDLYLRGRVARRKGTQAGVFEAIAYFERAIELAPDYAPAHAGLAGSLHNLWSNFTTERFDGPMLARADAAAHRAVDLDPGDGWSHHALAILQQSRSRDWNAAERSLRRAVELDPGHWHPHRGLGVLLMRTGRLEEARESLYRALRIDPLSPGLNMLIGKLHLFLGEPEAALAFFRRCLELSPDHAEVPGQLALAYGALGDEASARESLLRWVPGGARPFLRVLGRLVGSDPMLEGLHALRRTQSGDVCGGDATVAAAVYSTLGDEDHFFECLGREVRERHPWYLKVNPIFDPYRADPRFADLLRIARLEGAG